MITVVLLAGIVSLISISAVNGDENVLGGSLQAVTSATVCISSLKDLPTGRWIATKIGSTASNNPCSSPEYTNGQVYTYPIIDYLRRQVREKKNTNFQLSCEYPQ